MKIRMLLVLVAMLANIASVEAGGGHSGGGFYVEVKGKWVLLDDVEVGNPIIPEKESCFGQVKKVLTEVEQRVPDFAHEMKKGLKKEWRVVPFNLNCEDPGTTLQGNLSAGACQDKFEVIISGPKYLPCDPGLIIHELIQSVRVDILSGGIVRPEEFPPRRVRMLKDDITNKVLSAKDLRNRIYELGFGSYATAEEIALRREAFKWDQVRQKAKTDKVLAKARLIISAKGSGYDEHQILFALEDLNSFLGELIRQIYNESHLRRDEYYKSWLNPYYQEVISTEYELNALLPEGRRLKECELLRIDGPLC